ncbi:MAG: DegT/DnrJ/EryC1/StrS family aminotransferase [Veillonellales bacterium]
MKSPTFENLLSLSIHGGNFDTFYKGRVALYALLHEMGIGKGDQVLMPAYTCVVVPNAVLYLGAEPLYADIELSSFSVNSASVENALSERTKVVLCQNTYGLSAHVDEIVDLCRKRGIRTIEDCTHGFGGTYKGKPNGSWCDAAFYSSQWNKPFSTGLGGYALVNDPELAPKVAAFADNLPQPPPRTQAMLWVLMRVRKLISPATYYSFVQAYRYLSKRNLVTGSSSGEELESIEMPKNYLLGMSDIQKRVAEKALVKLPQVNALRKANGALYTAHLAQTGLNHVDPSLHENHLFLKYPLLVHNRKAFMRKAREANIPLGDWFCSPLHPVEGDLNQWKFDPERYPNAVFAASHVVNIPTDTQKPEKVLDFIDRNADMIMDVTLGGRLC